MCAEPRTPTGGDATARTSPRPAVLILAALSIVATSYSAVGHGDFVWDDRSLVLEQPAVHQLDPVAYLTTPFWTPSPFKTGHDAYFRPLTTLSYAIDWRLSGGAPGWFHLTNLALHLTVCALLFGLARSIGASPVASAVAATMFGLQPRLTECVAWVSGRTDVLATGLALAALWIHVARPGRLANRLAAAGLVFLGLLAKEVALAAACGISAMELARARRGSIGAAAVAAAPVAAAVGAYAVLRISVLGSGPALAAAIPMPGLARVLTPFDALGHYALMAVDFLRPRLRIGLLGIVSPATVAVGVAVAAVIALVLWRTFRRGDPPAVALAVTGAVAIGLVVHLVQIRVSVIAADRFLYLPAAAGAVLLARAASRATARAQRFAAIACCVAVPALGVATHQRTSDWTDEVALWRRAVETTTSEDPLPIHEYGTALYRIGRMEEAATQYQRAADLSTGRRRSDALADVATTLSDMGRVEEGVAKMREAMALAPPRPSYYYNLGVLEARRLQLDAAEAELLKALAMLPRYGQAASMLNAVRQARAALSSMPSPEPGEPAAVKARRADIDDQLTATVRAGQLWREVIGNTDATGDHCLSAAAFFMRAHLVDDARQALACARQRGAKGETIGHLESLLPRADARP